MAAAQGITLRRTSAAQQLADELRDRIVAGVFAPGDRLRESVIAEEVGLARNTVREAIRILEVSGLVHHRVNKGAVVISATVDELTALGAARERLETAAAARTPEPDGLAAIQAALDEMADVVRSQDAARIIDSDLAFHAALVALLGSSRLDAFYAGLSQELRFYLMVLSAEDHEAEHPDRILAAHRSIVDALRSGDRELAIERVRAHVDKTTTRLVEILTAREAAAAPTDDHST